MRPQPLTKKQKPHSKQHQKQHNLVSHVKWLESYPTCSKWASQYNVEKLLKKGGGICKLSNFLPQHVAEGILTDLEKVSAEQWNATEADNDYRQNNISHSFKSTRQAPCLQRAIRVLSLLLPEMLHSFSAAKYQKSDHIAPHDDRQYTQMLMKDGSILTCSRDITLVYYLTKDWKESDGGLLIDLEAPGGPHTYVPEFNSAILFTVPRWHQVTAMKTNRPRYTLFGWWLVPGRTYELNLGDEQPPATFNADDGSGAEQRIESEGDAQGHAHSGDDDSDAGGNSEGAGEEAGIGDVGQHVMREPSSGEEHDMKSAGTKGMLMGAEVSQRGKNGLRGRHKKRGSAAPGAREKQRVGERQAGTQQKLQLGGPLAAESSVQVGKKKKKHKVQGVHSLSPLPPVTQKRKNLDGGTQPALLKKRKKVAVVGLTPHDNVQHRSAGKKQRTG